MTSRAVSTNPGSSAASAETQGVEIGKLAEAAAEKGAELIEDSVYGIQGAVEAGVAAIEAAAEASPFLVYGILGAADVAVVVGYVYEYNKLNRKSLPNSLPDLY